MLDSPTTPVAPQREPELLGQTVVLIGGSAGIGLETARRASAEGADVILTGRNPTVSTKQRRRSVRNAPRPLTPTTRRRWRAFSRTCRHRSTTCW